nr:immunoglobulin heavy chain junction region [Macaca mulatta]
CARWGTVSGTSPNSLYVW